MLAGVTLIGVDCVDLARLKRAAAICEAGLEFGAVKLLSSIADPDPRVTRIPALRSVAAYSCFCVCRLADFVETPHALVIQHDGFVLNPAAWTEAFTAYDYIGAPWYHLGETVVGNGGFSLRSRRLLALVRDHHRAIGGALDPEDFWICVRARRFLESRGMRFAPPEVAERFSIEGNRRTVVWSGQLGFHDLRRTDISRWTSAHPEHSIDNPLDRRPTAARS